MDRQDIVKRLLYPKCKTAIEFKFDSLLVNPLLSYITVQDIAQLNKIATSLKYSSKPKEKYIMIDKIMTNRGFKKMASGTNRVTYRCLNDYRIVIKIAIDKVGLSDNGNEYRNQQLLKPFVTKCFEVSPCGTVGLFERVIPITSREEFINISDDIFDLINNLIGKYVLEDIGEKFYMNYGLREGFGPVLLDYPYVFELDGRKLICNVPEPIEPKGYCGGEIDYDLGYNDLICKKCGKRYLATELKSDSKSDKPKIIIEGEDTIMKCVLKRGDEIVSKLNSEAPVTTNTIKPKRDFAKLKAHLSSEGEPEPAEKKDEYKPTIKTSDEVQLVARLRGTPTSKDIDAEARRKEAILDARSEKIQVAFEPFEVKPEAPVSDFSVTLSESVEEEKTECEEEPITLEVIEKPNNTFTAIIKNDGEIWNWETDEFIGYSKDAVIVVDSENEYNDITNSDKEDSDKETEESLEEDESSDVAYSDSNDGFTIGDIINNKSSFKTTDITAPIENYFSNSSVVNSEEESEAEEEDDVPNWEEEYDPEYDGNDEDSEEKSENNIDLY